MNNKKNLSRARVFTRRISWDSYKTPPGKRIEQESIVSRNERIPACRQAGMRRRKENTLRTLLRCVRCEKGWTRY